MPEPASAGVLAAGAAGLLARRRRRRRRRLAGWVGPAAAAAAASAAWPAGAAATGYTFGVSSGTAEWTTPGNWTPSTGFPDAVGDTAYIPGSGNPGVPLTVDVNAPVTTSALSLGGGLNSNPGANTVSSSGGGSITFAPAAAGSSAQLTDGTTDGVGNTVSAAVFLAGPLTVTHGSSFQALALSGPIADAPGTSGNPVTFANTPGQAGFVTLTGNNQFTGPITVTSIGVGLSGQATGWGLSSGVTLNAGGQLSFAGATPVRAVPITLNAGAIVATSNLGGATADVVASPVTIVAGTVIVESQLTLSGPITGSGGGLTTTTPQLYPSPTAAPALTVSGTVNLGGGPLTVGSSTYVANPTYTAPVLLTAPDDAVGTLSVGSGSLVVTGGLTATSLALGTDGLVRIGTGGTAGTLAVPAVTAAAGAYNDTVTFDRSDAVPFAAAVSGPANLAQVGTGTTTLTGANRRPARPTSRPGPSASRPGRRSAPGP